MSEPAAVRDVALLPEQRRFLTRRLANRNHWNIATLLTVGPPFNAAVCEQALGLVAAHHEGLHVALPDEGPDGYGRVHPPTGRVPFEVVDLSDCADTDVPAAVEAVAGRLQRSLDLAEPPPVCAAYFSLGPGRDDRLLLIVHHFVADAVSMQVLVRDLAAAGQQLADGVVPALRRAGTPATEWADALAEMAASGELNDHVEAWRRIAAPSAPLPVEFPDGVNSLSSGATAAAALPPAESALLSQVVGGVVPRLGVGIYDLVAAALIDVLSEWSGCTSLRLNLHSHGRRGLSRRVNLTRTVGWLATAYPVTVAMPARRDDVVRTVGAQLAAVPAAGTSFSVLRYMSPDPGVVEMLSGLGDPEVAVNYLGHTGEGLGGHRSIGRGREPTGSTQPADGIRTVSHFIDVAFHSGQLVLLWSYSTNLYRPSTVQQLVDGVAAAMAAWVREQ